MTVPFKFLALLLLLLAIPTSAQEPTLEPLGPGEGRPAVLPIFSDYFTANPLLAYDTESAGLARFYFPALIGRNPDTGVYEPGVLGSLATDWSYSEDGTTLTITLRDDWTWNDGTPITSADVQYVYDAAASGQMDSPLNTGLDSIVALTSPDPRTVVLTFAEADCTAVEVAAAIPVVPAHYYRAIYPSFADITAENPNNLSPQVTGGPFKFGSYQAGRQMTLLADQNYPDSPAGYVVPEGVILKNVADPIVAYQQFLDGQFTLITPPPDSHADARTRAAAGEFHIYEAPSDGYTIMFFNLADPATPLSAVDESGNAIAQPPHPILGSLNVRRAIAHAIDHAALNMGVYEGTGRPVGGSMLPHSWAYNAEIAPYTFDPTLSMRLLEEAGWNDHDGDVETPRIATDGVDTAPAGTPLEISLTINADNVFAEAAATLLQDQLKQVGIGLRIEAIAYQTLVDMLLGQSFDIVMIGLDFPQSEPHLMSDWLDADADVVGSGFNTMSYANAEFDEIMAAARVVPGCDLAERKALYDRAQQIIYDELPYYIVNTSVGPTLVQNNVENFDPKPFGIFWNYPAWSIR